MSCAGDIGALFPRPTTGTLTEPGAIAIQCLPTTSALFVWLTLELAKRRRKSSHFTITFVYISCILVFPAFGLLAWRTFDLFQCGVVVFPPPSPPPPPLPPPLIPPFGAAWEEVGQRPPPPTVPPPPYAPPDPVLPPPDVEKWRMVAVIGAPAVAAGIVLLGRRFPRLGAFAALALASGTVFGDWAIRKFSIAEAAQTMVSIQQLWCFIAIASLVHLGPKSPKVRCNDKNVVVTRMLDFVAPKNESSTTTKTIRGKTAACLDVVDPLSRIDTHTPVPCNRHSSWFSP